MFTITDRLGIGSELRELKLGKSFQNIKLSKDGCNILSHGEAFHTIRYDFKPASVDTTKMAGIEFGENNKVTVTMQNVESSGLPKTVFKGSRKPHQKECVLVIDHETGDITLERLTHNIIVKKIRAEGSCKAQIPRPITPSIEMNGKKNSPPFQSGLNISKPISPKPGPILHETGSQLPSLSSLSIIQNGSPSNTKSNKSSPINGSSFLINHKSPINQSTTLSHSISNLASLNKSDDEMIGILSDSSSDSSDHDSSSSDNSDSSSDDEVNDKKQSVNQSNGGHSSKSNSSESESDSNSDSDDDQINKSNKGTTYGSNVPNMPSMPKFSQLSVDLQLSESGSDSD